VAEPSTEFAPGAYAILATPFDCDERLDVEGLARLTAFYEERGATGLVVLAVMGEGAKLDDDERRRAIETVVAARRSAPVTVGVTAPSAHLVRRRIDQARELGAESVLLSPSAGMDGDAVRALFAEAGRSGAAIVLQDHPQSSGVAMPAALIGRILAEVEAVVAIKNEAPPTAIKTRQVLQAAGGGRAFTLLGGLGALSLLDEMDAGAHGTMTGFAYPEVLTAVVSAYRAGDRARARALYEAFLPWLVFESTAAVSLAIRKEFLRLRGCIDCAVVRAPAPALDPGLTRRAAELHEAFAQAARAHGLG
jgi:4-hydroxy-tetrahydrodipicolinate synthase